MDKKQIRCEVRARLNALNTGTRAHENEIIFKKLTSLPEYKNAKCIFMYISVFPEADTRKILTDALSHARVCIPRCGESGIMQAVEIKSASELVNDKFDIPSAPRGNAEVEPDDIDFALVPGVAFTRGGARLGRGGGYYDRYLSRTDAFKAGICHSVQIYDELPCDAHDVAVDCVISCGDE